MLIRNTWKIYVSLAVSKAEFNAIQQCCSLRVSPNHIEYFGDQVMETGKKWVS